MAASFSISTPIKSLFFTLLLISITVCQSNGQGSQQTALVVFLHDVASGPDATVAAVTGVSGKVWSYNKFGTMYVVDDPLTLTPNLNSTQVGRAQGVLSASSLDGTNMNVMLSIVFNNLQYNGSTLEIQGTSRQLEHYREVSVVSGTGRFRFARGFAALETVYYDTATTHSIVRLTLNLVLP